MNNSKKKPISLQAQQALILEMAISFHRLCVENDIPYYMLGGSMLGAIRHKGFIPWDDDMDFGIPRQHFSRFLDLSRNSLPSHIKLLYYDTSDYSILGFAKLSDTRTLVEETFSPLAKESIGVNIDIFPLDITSSNRFFFSFNGRIRLLFKIQKLMFFNPENRPFFKRLLAKASQFVFKMKKETIPLYLENELEERAKKKNGGNSYANFFGAWGLKEVVGIEVFGKPILYTFENVSFYGVEKADAYLKQLYGDYMIVPDEANRHIHTSNVFYVE